MKIYAVLFSVLAFLTAYPQAQQSYDMDQVMNDRINGIPILDPKLSLLIRDVEMANWRSVDYHNKKIVKAVKKNREVSEEWLLEHALLVAKWTAWNDVISEWYTKKKVEASATLAVGGGVKVRNMDAIETQNKVLGIWRMTKNQVDEIDENKELWGGMKDLSKLWSEFAGRVKTLDKAINSLRKY